MKKETKLPSSNRGRGRPKKQEVYYSKGTQANTIIIYVSNVFNGLAYDNERIGIYNHANDKLILYKPYYVTEINYQKLIDISVQAWNKKQKIFH